MSGNPAFNQVFVSVTPPAAIVDGNPYTTGEVDTVDATLGKAAYTNFYVYIGATDIAVAAFKIQECDTSGGSFDDITGATFGTLPSATNDNTCWAVTIVNGANRKRYYDLVLTAGNGSTGTYAAAWAFNCFPGIKATSATQLGLGGLASV